MVASVDQMIKWVYDLIRMDEIQIFDIILNTPLGLVFKLFILPIS